MSFYMKSYKEIEKYQINFKDEKIARQKPSIQQVSDLVLHENINFTLVSLI